LKKQEDRKREKPFGAHGEWRPSTAKLGKQLSGRAHRKRLCSSRKEAVAENFTPTRPSSFPAPPINPILWREKRPNTRFGDVPGTGEPDNHPVAKTSHPIKAP